MPTLSNDCLERIPAKSRAPLQDLGTIILKRAAHMLPADRLLVRLAVESRVNNLALAEILKVEPGTVTRRLRSVTRRLSDPLVVFLLDPVCPLSVEHRQLGIEHFLQGQSFKQLAELHQMYHSQVREMLEHVKGCFRGVSWRKS